MKKLKIEKWGKYIPIGLLTLNLILTIIFFSIKISPEYKGESIWQSVSLYKGRSYVHYFCVAFLILFGIEVLLYGFSLYSFFRKKIKTYFVAVPLNLGLDFLIFGVHVYYKFLKPSALFFLWFSLLLMMATLVILILFKHFKLLEESEKETKPLPNRWVKRIVLGINGFSVLWLISLFLIPLYKNKVTFTTTTYILIAVLGKNTYGLNMHILFMVFFIAFFMSLMYFISLFSYYFKEEKKYLSKSKVLIYGNLALTLLFFIAGYFISFYYTTKGENATTISFIPFLVMILPAVIFSLFQGKYIGTESFEEKNQNKKFKLEPLLFVILFTVITFISVFFNIIEVQFDVASFSRGVKLNGYTLLKDYHALGSGYQILAFFIYSILVSSGIFMVLSLVSFLSKYKDYYKVIKISVYANVIFMMLLGLSGTYFKISQKINEDNLNSLLEYYNVSLPIDYSYKIKSQTIYVFAACLLVLVIMMFRGQLNHSLETLDFKKTGKPVMKEEPSSVPDFQTEETTEDFDACPAFTELDSKKEAFDAELAERRKLFFENPTLPSLVRFIVDYARESRLHLSYTLEDIATFVAGLGASRLTILQGMSGTGKTSLPKIFTEAIMGNCEIIEVESSWRDKNELLGYYNEFSKSFTPKKFTQCLYKAKLNPEVTTFIVLDEMNLSRIEYYFSDFLSLMEHEEHKREIKLLNIKLHRTVNHQQISYLALTDGHTIKIPTNVWFIGTANRDESTFEISDKVYDRAQTMNFNKRAPKIHSFSKEIPPRFLSYEELAKLLKEGKESFVFDAEDNEIIKRVEKLLAPYNISFGNRVLKQMEDFVKIYCACFGDREAVLNEAVEKILLSKVVSKLETKIVENKEKLAIEFDKLSLMACSAFVRKLNED